MYTGRLTSDKTQLLARLHAVLLQVHALQLDYLLARLSQLGSETAAKCLI